MQFIKNGPTIPETLLLAHEEGRVVFFCGAGISFPAGLPGFKTLVNKLYDSLQPAPNDVQEAAITNQQYDIAVGLLEDELGSREVVRREMAKVLTPDLSARDAFTTHRALLSLAKTRKGSTRLITTNFDRLFEEVIARDGLKLEPFCAPLLPVPKNRWNGLVYLHGLLSTSPSRDELDRLVISSGDFGLAYLTERWAARFVSELFRNYVVCFVGYSLADPVLRYMTDALAADRLRGEASPEMFAFASYAGTKASHDKASREWRAKNVIPLLYKETKDHSNLHKTIRAWEKTYSAGARGKGKIVQDCILAGPLASTVEDDLIGRMLWAISEPDGTPARLFAEHSPAPTLDWLPHFCDTRFEHRDLPRFGVSPDKEVDVKLRFSLAHRPMPYSLAAEMSIVSHGGNPRAMDRVMSYLALWLVRYLDAPELLLWLASRGGHLSEPFASQVRKRLEETAQMEERESAEEIKRFKDDSPHGIPRPAMRTLWNLVLLGRVGSANTDFHIFEWVRHFLREGMTTALRLQFKQFLGARVILRKPIRLLSETSVDIEREQQLRHLVNAEVVLTDDHLRIAMEEVKDSLQWQNALPELFGIACEALRDVLDLMREIGQANERSDPSMWDMPSIIAHWQNRHYKDWTLLIELVRDSWSAIFQSNPERAHDLMNTLRQMPYPTFMRLALNAAREEGDKSTGAWVKWLLEDDAWWLWSTETQRETMRLLATSSKWLTLDSAERLQQAILTGPPRRMFREDVDDARWEDIVERMQWLRLAKFKAGGGALVAGTTERLAGLETKHPQWHIGSDFEREEFAHWMSGTGDPDYHFQPQIDLAPRRRSALTTWLQKEPERALFREDDWRELCRTNSRVAIASLLELATRDVWPRERWSEALSTWSNDGFVRRSWSRLANCVLSMPDDVFREVVSATAWWLHEVGKQLDVHQATFISICERVLRLPTDDFPDTDDAVMRSMSNPLGQVTQALLNWWFSEPLKDNQGLPRTIASIFTRLCDPAVHRFRHGRTLLASNVVALYRVDRLWTQTNLLPLFDWRKSDREAYATWMGYLWAPRLHKDLLVELKTPFLDSAQQYMRFGDARVNYASMLTLAALDTTDIFSRAELQKAVRALPDDGLVASAHAVHSALKGANARQSEYWALAVQPYFASIWPKTMASMDARLPEIFARIAVAADREFPDALDTVKSWLKPISYPYQLLKEMNVEKIGERFPGPALSLLVAVIDKNRFAPPDLNESLRQIASADEKLTRELEFQALEDFVRRR
ncbi:anti-phage defense-associated sirtuin Dsr1 [Burkholderia thailandensis]|uniref:anti-phage defense-associated sirtuin Dsr1 n=1 Tax=Burkholderia thailandensis TaxID=57975 RepID=UPI001378FECE|nr:hypothetical protein [Burkholderia thailandensis]